MLRNRIVRSGLYLFEILSAFLIQSVPVMYGWRAVLLVSVGLTAASAEGQAYAVLTGALCGLLADIPYSGGTGLFSFGLPVCCYLVSLVFEEYLRRSIFTVMPVSGIFISLLLIIQLFINCGTMTDIWNIFTKQCLPEIFYTVSAVPFYYFLQSVLVSVQGRRNRPRKRTLQHKKR